MKDKIKTQLVELARDVGAETVEVDEEEATYKTSNGDYALNPGYIVKDDENGAPHYFTVSDDALYEKADKINLMININKLNSIKIIKGCVVFFTVLAVIAIIIGIIYGIKIGDVINTLKESF